VKFVSALLVHLFPVFEPLPYFVTSKIIISENSLEIPIININYRLSENALRGSC